MIRRSRRLSLHLTPLLDLLLIVIFAQFMDVRQQETERAGASQQLQLHLDRVERELATVRTEARETSLALTQAEQALNESRSRSAERERRDTELTERLSSLHERQRVLARMVSDVFRVPDSLIDAVLNPERDPAIATTPGEASRLRTRFEEIARANPGQMIEHLVTYAEIRKRADVWKLHLSRDPLVLTLDDGREVRTLPLPLELDDPSSGVNQELLSRDLYGLLSRLPEPKSLVIALLSHDPRTRNIVLMPVRETVGEVIDRLRRESGGRSQFQFVDVGILVPEEMEEEAAPPME